MRVILCLATASLTLVSGGCKNADQPAKADKPAATRSTQPTIAAQSPERQGSTVTTKKDDKAMTTGSPAAAATAAAGTSPLLTKAHTLTTKGKEAVASGKLPENLSAATFGAGCFWGVESTFRKLPGVLATSVGFSGGRTVAPTYKQICDDPKGHAEVVDVVYDPALVSYDKLLETFFANHNPTQVNRQGPDFGEQYRTVIFFHDDAQKAAAEKAKDAEEASGKWRTPIATQIVKFEKFWPAEDYHQTYLEKKGLDVCH